MIIHNNIHAHNDADNCDVCNSNNMKFILVMRLIMMISVIIFICINPLYDSDDNNIDGHNANIKKIYYCNHQHHQDDSNNNNNNTSNYINNDNNNEK